MSRRWKIVAVVMAASACVLVTRYLSSNVASFQEQIEANRRTALAAQFQCPLESSEVQQQWGWVGYERSCAAGGVAYGPVMAWENGSQLRGQYAHGKQDGEWQWLDRGVVTHTIRYEAGVQVYDSLGRAGSPH